MNGSALALKTQDTQVDVRSRRKLRIPGRGQARKQLEGASLSVPLFKGNPGNTMARSGLSALRVRETIVRRNHFVDRSLEAQQAEEAHHDLPKPQGFSKVQISFARSRDQRQRLSLYGKDALLVEGIASGASKVGGQKAALSIGVDGLIFTVAVERGDTAKRSMARLAERLSAHFEVELKHNSAHKTLLRLVRRK